MRTLRVVAVVLVAFSAAGQTVVPVERFRSIELHDGGSVVVRRGSSQRVTLLGGDQRYTQVRVEDGRLMIHRCEPDCPRGYRVQIEVVTPELAGVAVSNGGTIRIADAFPEQSSIAAAVEQGGTIDIRSIPADAVQAAIDSGGRILTTVRESLTAAIVSGGAITYWGDPRVRQAIHDGGSVRRGARADAGRPLDEFGDEQTPIPPVPPVAPVAPVPPAPPAPPHP